MTMRNLISNIAGKDICIRAYSNTNIGNKCEFQIRNTIFVFKNTGILSLKGDANTFILIDLTALQSISFKFDIWKIVVDNIIFEIEEI